MVRKGCIDCRCSQRDELNKYRIVAGVNLQVKIEIALRSNNISSVYEDLI